MESSQVMVNLGAVMVSIGAVTLGSLAYFIKRLIKDFDEMKKEMQHMHKDLAVLKAEVVKRNGFDSKIEKLRAEFKDEILLAINEGRIARAEMQNKIEACSKQLLKIKGKQRDL